MSDLDDQYQCPTGPRGRLVAKMMNQHHEPLTLWGLTKTTVGKDYVILDVGCGGGKTLGKLAKLAPMGQIFGLDCSIDMAKFSKKINKTLVSQNRLEIIEASVDKICFRNAHFDLVTAFETYYFWTNLPDALNEIKRVIKPGGHLLLVNELMFGVTSAKIIEETHVKLLPLDQIQNLLKSAGFVSVRVFTEAESPWNAILAQK